jgi:hypothetical protein
MIGIQPPSGLEKVSMILSGVRSELRMATFRRQCKHVHDFILTISTSDRYCQMPATLQYQTPVIEQAMSAALIHYAETMGEPFPVTPRLTVVDETEFWAAAELDGTTLTISVSTGTVKTLSDLWIAALADSEFRAGIGQPIQASAEDMTHLGLVWLMLHELHHYQMRHFNFTGQLCLTEANAPKSYGVASRADAPSPALINIDKDKLHKVEPCLEMQADHDAIEMMLDAYSADGWDMVRARAAAISAMMVLIERVEGKKDHQTSTPPQAATRIFQLIGHVIEMPLMQAMLAQRHPESDIDPEIPSDEEQSAFNRQVVIPSFFDAVGLARIANADAIGIDLGGAQGFFRDVQLAKLSCSKQSDEFTTQGAMQWSELLSISETLMRAR